MTESYSEDTEDRISSPKISQFKDEESKDDIITAPQRIVFRFNEKFIREEQTILNTFFSQFNIDPGKDYHSHLCAANESVMMHIVLDLYCKTYPDADVQAIEHKVFELHKTDQLFVYSLL